MKVLPLILFLLLTACGKNLDQFQTAGLSASNLPELEGRLTVPAMWTQSSVETLYYQGRVYYLIADGTTQEVVTILGELISHQTSAAPISHTSSTYTYQVRFTGVFGLGMCPYNGASQCSTVSMKTLSPY